MASGNGTRWLVGAIWAAITAALGFLLVADRGGFDRRLSAVEVLSIATSEAQKAHEARSDARWEEIRRSLERIEADVMVVKSRK